MNMTHTFYMYMLCCNGESLSKAQLTTLNILHRITWKSETAMIRREHLQKQQLR